MTGKVSSGVEPDSDSESPEMRGAEGAANHDSAAESAAARKPLDFRLPSAKLVADANTAMKVAAWASPTAGIGKIVDAAGWTEQLAGIGRILDSAALTEQLAGIGRIVDAAGWTEQLAGIGKIVDAAGWTEQLAGIGKVIDSAGWTEQLAGIGKIVDSAGWTEQLAGIGKIVDAAGWTEQLADIGTVVDEARWAQLLAPPPDTLAVFLRDVEPFADLDEEMAELELRLLDDGFGPEAISRALVETRLLLVLRRVAVVAFFGVAIGVTDAAPLLNLILALIHGLLLKYPLVGVAIGLTPQGYRFGRWLLALDDDLEPSDGEDA